MPLSAQDVRDKFRRFRILVVGRANAGKTTLLQKVCNTTEKPEIFDGKGKKINPDVVKSSVDHGEHNIINELVFQSNPGFVFHDSCGFEAGGADEFKKMKEFVSERASTMKLNERIHAIWYCIPMDEYHRAITVAEERFFSECDTNNVPVIAVLTKFDALSAVALGELRATPGLTRKDIFEKTPKLVDEIFANAGIWDRLCATRHPPKDYVCLAEMNLDKTDCGPLLECTTGALGDEALEILLISTQQTNLELCIMYAVKKVALPYIKRAHQELLQGAEHECIVMQKKIANWFPHTEMVLHSSFMPSASSGIAQTLYIVIATSIVLEYSFFLLQKGEQEPAKISELAASEYVASQVPLAIKGAIEELLHEYHDGDRGHEQLCKMITDRILQNRMSLGVQK